MTRATDALLVAASAALAPLPTSAGGIVVVLATAGPPPAIAMLSSGDVHLDGETVRVAVHAGSSAGGRLGGAFTLLVPDGGRALRVEAVEATARVIGELALLEGRLARIRPTAEPPWTFDLSFHPESLAGVDRFVAYWAGVREWLADPDRDPPTAP